MPKVDLKLALAEYEAEGKGIVNINYYMHPLQGLQDSKGSLTRYPVLDKDTGEKLVFVDYNWLAEYLLAGGKLDAQRVYGISPYRIEKDGWGHRKLDVEKVNPLQLVSLLKEAHLQRFDNIEFFLLSIVELGFVQLEPTAKLRDVERMARGIQRYNRLTKAGIEVKNSIMSLGWWSEDKMEKVLVENAEDFTLEDAVKGHFAGISKYDVIEKAINKNPVVKIFMTDFATPSTSYTSTGSITFFPNVEAYTIVAKESEYGHIKEYAPLKEVRKVGDYFVFEEKGYWFAWERSKQFSSHREGKTLKEAIDKLEGVKRIKGNEMSLRDVRENSNFCFAGTKNFLRNKMPFLHYMVQSYSNWNDVPSDIMDIQWSLADRSIFNGYSQP